MSVYNSTMRLCKRGDHEFDTHPLYGQVYMNADRPSEYDFVIVNGQLYLLDDEDLVQRGVIQTIQVELENDASKRIRITAEQAKSIVPNTASVDV